MMEINSVPRYTPLNIVLVGHPVKGKFICTLFIKLVKESYGQQRAACRLVERRAVSSGKSYPNVSWQVAGK